MHEKSGLLSSIETSNIKLKEAEKITLDFISKYVEKNSSPLCGNTIYQDRMFLKKEMQKLEEFLHYRNLDVSTLKELYKSWKGDIGNLPVKKSNHRAMTDILESIDESPQLPYGYPTSILLSMVPPLWFRIMNPRVESFQN